MSGFTIAEVIDIYGPIQYGTDAAVFKGQIAEFELDKLKSEMNKYLDMIEEKGIKDNLTEPRRGVRMAGEKDKEDLQTSLSELMASYNAIDQLEKLNKQERLKNEKDKKDKKGGGSKRRKRMSIRKYTKNRRVKRKNTKGKNTKGKNTKRRRVKHKNTKRRRY